MKHDARQALGLFADSCGDVVGDSLSFAVLIGCEVDLVGVFGELFDLFYYCGVIGAYFVFGSKFFALDLDTECRLWQIPDMAF